MPSLAINPARYLTDFGFGDHCAVDMQRFGFYLTLEQREVVQYLFSETADPFVFDRET